MDISLLGIGQSHRQIVFEITHDGEELAGVYTTYGDGMVVARYLGKRPAVHVAATKSKQIGTSAHRDAEEMVRELAGEFELEVERLAKVPGDTEDVPSSAEES